MSEGQPTLGAVMRELRARFGWTLKEMSAKTGIPVSTLSKVEHDRLTLTYDKLQQVSQRLNMRMSDLFAEGAGGSSGQAVLARRSMGGIEQAFRVETPNYDYHYLCSELLRKLMIPVIARVRSHSAKEFGDLVHHNGEEFIYVLEGRIVVHTEYYDPVELNQGQYIYLDSTMGHAYVTAEGCEEATLLSVCASSESGLMEALMKHH